MAKLRELSPLWEMFKDGVDLSYASSGPRTKRRSEAPVA